MKKVDFYFDYLSPYSYFAWINHKSIKAEFSYKPIAMGSLFSHWQMKGPGEIIPKRIYMLKQCFQYAALKQVKFNPPTSHPFNPLYALRLSTRSIGLKQKDIIDLLFDAVWGQGLDLSQEENLTLILKKYGVDPKDYIDKTFDPKVKAELKENLNEAKERMLFGVPSFYVGDELFWGNDSLESLEKFLNGETLHWNESLFKERLSLN